MTTAKPITNSIQKKSIWLLVAFILAILADSWFWLQSPRLGWLVWCLLLVSVRYSFELYVNKNIRYLGLFTGGLICILSFFVYYRSSEFLSIINIIATIYLIFLMWRGYRPTFDYNPFISNLVIEPLSTWIQGIEKGFASLTVFKPKAELHKSDLFAAIFRGLLITIPIISIFSILLSWSDANFAKIVSDNFASLFKYFSLDGFTRLGFLIATTILIFGLGFVLKANHEIKKEIPALIPNNTINWESVILFTSVILLFGSYLVLQASYLIGGRSFVVQTDETYAEFAKRGFFELSTVTVLVFGLILITDKIVNNLKMRSKSFGLLASIIILQTFLLLLSAWSKLSLYIQGYGYTNLRLYTQVWIVCMGLSLVLLLLREVNLFKPNVFSNGVFAIFLVGLIILNFINPEYTIAKYNLTQNNWNISEIGNYGYDSYPAISQLLQDPKIQTKIDSAAYCRLKSNALALKDYQKNATWNQRNLSLDKAAEILSKVKLTDNSFACPYNSFSAN